MPGGGQSPADHPANGTRSNDYEPHETTSQADRRRGPITWRAVTDPNYQSAGAFIGALAHLGLENAWITPGSRNTPLALTLAAHGAVRDWSHHDERSAGFLALGMARTTGRPVAVACTSGTAAAELLPAAVEARHARVPLLLLTADRPPELRDVGAPQAIDQVRMYGNAVKWSHDAGVPVGEPGAERRATMLAARAWAEAGDNPAGPVHVNLPFREPLAPSSPPPADAGPSPARVLRSRAAPEERVVGEVAELLRDRRVLIVAGPQDDAALAPALADLAAAGGYPIVADALSGVRCGDHDRSAVVATGHALAAAGFLDAQAPDVVIRFGAVPTAKPVWRWLGARTAIPQVLVDVAGWRDPEASAHLVVRADGALTAAALAKALRGRAPDGWLAAWRAADDAAAAAQADAVAGAGFPSEPAVVTALGDVLPAGAVLWTASSMPVRDVDEYLAGRAAPLRIIANRGANGIDGFLSSGLGSALVSAAPTYLHAGDLSALYDLTALAAAARYGIPATIVVVNNDGGGIFHFLPGIGDSPHFERHFGTPHGYSLAELAAPFGVASEQVDSRDAFEAALRSPPEGPRLVEVMTDRRANVEIHEATRHAVATAIAS